MAEATPDILAGDWLAQRRRGRDQRLALVAEGSSLSYGELDMAVRDRAAELSGHGVCPGDVVVVELRPGIDFAVSFHALHRIGAAILPLNPRLPDSERMKVLEEADPSLLVEAGGALESGAITSVAVERRGIIADSAADPVLARIMTSGTSGSARQIELSRGNFSASALGTADALGIDACSHWLCCMPLFHVGGLSILSRAAILGTTAEIHDGFDVDRVAAAIADREVSGVSLVATQLGRLLEAGVDLSGPSAIVVGGGPLSAQLLEEAVGRGARILQTYGLTEACSQVTILRPGEADDHTGSSGRPVRDTQVRIEEGEIWVKGPTVARGSLAPDGWLHTGDLGRIDEQGYLYVTDRLGDMIVSGGENVLPGAVEDVLRSHPDVDDVAVVGREDAEWGEVVTAVVVLASGASADPQALRAHSASRLAPHQVPKKFEFASELPRTASGKLRRRELR